MTITLPRWLEPYRYDLEFGPDMSSWQCKNGVTPDQAITKAAGCSHFITRIGSCNGDTRTGKLYPFSDPYARLQLENSLAHGMTRGAYQLFDYSNPNAVADRLYLDLKAAGIEKPDRGIPVKLHFDAEQKYKWWTPMDYEKVILCLDNLIEAAESLGFEHGWYSNKATYMDLYLRGLMPDWLKAEDFWLSWIMQYAPPKEIKYSVVQFTFNGWGPTYGTKWWISRSVDLNAFFPRINPTS